jgi:hypothetical protein
MKNKKLFKIVLKIYYSSTILQDDKYLMDLTT